MYVTSENGTVYQVGIISFGFGCAQAGQYGVYASVEHFLPWIRNTVEGVTSETPEEDMTEQQRDDAAAIGANLRDYQNSEDEKKSMSTSDAAFIAFIVLGVLGLLSVAGFFGYQKYQKHQRRRRLMGYSSSELPVGESTTELMY